MGEFGDAAAKLSDDTGAISSPTPSPEPASTESSAAASTPATPDPATAAAAAGDGGDPAGADPVADAGAPAPGAAPGATPPPAADAKMVPAPALREARDTIKTLRETFGWLPKEHVPAIRGFYERWRRDPVGTFIGQLHELLADPEHGAKIRSLMGDAGDAGGDHEPGPDLRDETTGELAYSAAQTKKWQQWHARQGDARLDQRLQPLQSFVQDAQNREQIAKMRQASTAKAKALFAPLKTNPHFVAHADAIKERYQLHAESMSPEAALYRATSEILSEKVIPGLSDAGRRDLAASLQRKTGVTSPNPARRAPAAAPVKRAGSFREGAERLLR